MVDVPGKGETTEGRRRNGRGKRIKHGGVEKLGKVRIEKALVGAIIRRCRGQYALHVCKDGGVWSEDHKTGVEIAWVDECSAKSSAREEWGEVTKHEAVCIDEDET